MTCKLMSIIMSTYAHVVPAIHICVDREEGILGTFTLSDPVTQLKLM